jgi:predicted DNA-binding transcriptional regulator AlpA
MNDLISKDAASARAGICSRHLDNLVKRGEGPVPYRFGKSVRYDASEVDAWVASHRKAPASCRSPKPAGAV